MASVTLRMPKVDHAELTSDTVDLFLQDYGRPGRLPIPPGRALHG
jgi:hypothetical protein